MKATIIKLTKAGEHRVLDGKEGMTFLLDTMGGVDDRCAHVRDYRYPKDHFPFQIWTLGPGDFEVLEYDGPCAGYANQLAGRLTPNDNHVGFAPGEAEAIVAALDPQIRAAARKAWAKHPNNPANMRTRALAVELKTAKGERRKAVEDELQARADRHDFDARTALSN